MHSTESAALALGVDKKTLDNFIHRACASLVRPGRQGADRAIGTMALEVMAVALLLRRDLGISASRAVGFASDLVRGDHAIHVGTLGILSFDMLRLRAVLQDALASAAELHVPRARGRPRQTKKRGASA